MLIKASWLIVDYKSTDYKCHLFTIFAKLDVMNIAFHYLYRDSANYKNFNSVVFDNPDGISLEVLNKLLKRKLISEEYFYSNEWKIPDMHFGNWDSEIDHGFHQFESIEYTNEVANAPITLSEFMEIVANTKIF
jgi:hypothetical protein